jgi:hypothetical protein
VAFVAEFSRGKSELINAIFFAGYGSRILPSSAGRTTMCPTELQWTTPTSRRRSPAADRDTASPTPASANSSASRGMAASFRSTPSSAEAMQAALARSAKSPDVPPAEAEKLGFAIDDKLGDHGIKPDADGTVEIPRWRHAVINFPHPLLEQGLVILDTPGLNAIGAEPELTLSLLPNAHAVLFILAADTGVTQSDLAVWREHVAHRAPPAGASSCSTRSTACGTA